MDIQWLFLIKSAWPIFWITTIYSYLACGIAGTLTGIKTKGNRESINKKLEEFILSPFYIATFFCLLATLFFWQGTSVFRSIHHLPTVHMFIMGGMVFISHLGVEVLESTVIWKNPLRILGDKDALRLCGIYLIILIETALIAFFAS